MIIDVQVEAFLRKLLIVEDSDDIARGLQEGLQQLGYTVAVAHNGPLALQLSRNFSPEVALIDLGLPVMDGWELARRLRAQSPAIGLIAVTGNTDEAARARSVDAGFADHLIKPIRIDAIDRAVRAIAAR